VAEIIAKFKRDSMVLSKIRPVCFLIFSNTAEADVSFGMPTCLLADELAWFASLLFVNHSPKAEKYHANQTLSGLPLQPPLCCLQCYLAGGTVCYWIA